MSIELLMPSNHLSLCHPLLLPPSIFPSIRVFSSESTLCISSVQFSPSVVYDCLRPHGLQHARPITDSRNLLKLMSIELVMPSNQLILCHPLLLSPSIFPSIRVFPVSQLFASGGQSIGASASASALPMNIQDSFPLGLTGLIPL